MQFFIDNIWLTLLALSSGFGIIFLTLQEKTHPLHMGVSALEATQLVNRSHAIFLDLREPDDFNTGHIANSRNIPFSSFSQTDTPSNKLDKLSKDKPVVLVCSRGNMAKKAVRAMQAAGFKEVKVLQEGIAGWVKAGHLLSKKK